ncbi:tape measure protein [Tahibacter soli]|uniref:Tape measure protein n=1 Tax=Tahibacter soli TaxID=2983605 RepID=A0A9X4BHY5_9GAMM|nr:tape measure protein [Tahibacter soli]MDC8012943.1 tape measure protein [Tahibacter soli]
MTDPVVKLRLTLDSGQFVGDVRVSQRALADLSGSAGQTGNTLRSSTNDLERFGSAAERVSRQNISGLNAGLTTGAGLARQMGGALAGIGVAAFANELASTADEYTNLSSKVRLVTNSEQNLIDVRRKLYGIAQDTRADLSATSDLYTRLTRATTTLFIAEQDRLRISETVNKSFAVSGASATEAGAAITQFSQGLQSGALRGDEFNSVAEQAPILMELFAKSLGKTRGELRAMAEAGQLTAGILTRALLDGSRDIDKQFAQMSLTIGGASTQLANAWTRWIGESNEGVGASRLAASAISLLADNLGTVATLVLGIATVWGVRYVAGITAAALATRAQAAAVAAAAATNTTAQLAEARAAETAAVAHLARMRALEAGISSTGRAIAAEQALAVAQARTIAATEAATAAAITKVGALSRLGSGLSALVGGPLGAAVIALGALYLAYESVNKAAKDWEDGIAASSAQLDSAAAKTVSLDNAMKQLSKAPIPPIADVAKQYIDNVDLILVKHTELRDRTAALNDAIGGDWRALFASGNYTAPPEVQAVIDQVVKLENDLHRLEAAQASLGASLRGTVGPALDDASAAFARFRANADVGSILLGIGEGFTAIVSGTRTLAANASATAFFGDLSKKAADANEKLKTAGKSSTEIARAYVEQGLAAARLAGLSAELIAQKEREGNAYIATVAALDRAKASHTSTASAERLHDQQARQLEKTIEAQAQATDDLTDIQTDLAAGLNGPVARAMNEHQRLLDRIAKAAKVWLDQGPPTAAVQAELARVLADANAQYDVRLRQAEDEADVVARTLEQLDQEISLRGLSNEARTAEEVVIQAVNRAKEQGKPLSEEEIRQLRAGVVARQEMLRSIDGAREAYENNQRAYGNMVNSMADLGADVLTRQIRTWSDFRDALVGIVVDMVRQIIANWLRVQMLGNGGGGGFMNSVVQMFSGAGGGGASGGGFNAGNNSLTSRAGQAVAPWLANNPGFVGNVGAWGGAIAGANYGWNNRGSGNGSGGSIAGAATYGVAGWAAGTVAAGAVLGGSAAVAAGGTAVAGAATGAMGAMAAIPVIGWIALAIALIDKFTGGKIFGSRFKPDWATVALNVGESGGDATTTIREVRNRSLFRGREWQNREVESTEDAERAADELFESIGRVMKDDARRLGIEVPPILAASLQTIQDLDEKGRIKSTKYVVEMLGRTWEEATGELAALRITAEERIAVAAAASGGEASRIAEQWRDSAEKLAEGAEFLINAQTDIGQGRGLLGANSTLTEVTELVQDLANAGETLSQTYARLTVSAESWRRAIDILGVDMRTSGDAFVRFSADIVEAAGGIDRANALWSSFFENFGGSDLMQYQLDSVVNAAERELNDIGIDGLISLDEFKQRFKTALPTLTPEQVVQWLEAGNALAEATRAQESYANALKAYDDFVSGLRASLEPFAETPFETEMRAIDQWRLDTIDSMHQLARAAGLAAAKEEDLALVEMRAAQLRAQAIRQLEISTRDLVSRLYGGAPGSLDEVTRRIQELEAAQSGAMAGVGDVADASAQRYEDELAAIERIRGFVNSLLLNQQLTTLTPEQQLAEAQRQYDLVLARARAGDAQAMQQLPDLAQQLLDRARGYYSSGDQYQAIFDAVRSQLLGISPSSQPGGGYGTGGAVTFTASAELQALYERRDELLAEQERETRLAMAQQLAVQLRELGESSGRPILELAASLGVKLDQFVRDLGIDVADVTAQTVLQLADLASTLGISLGELAGAVGASLGELADANSAINDALEQRINALPAAERALLEPLFRAVEAATNAADANAAIASLQTATNALPAQYRDLLAPLLGMPQSTQTAIGNTASMTADVASNTAKFAEAAYHGGMSLAFQGDVSNASLVEMHSRLAEIRDALTNGAGINSGSYADAIPASKTSGIVPIRNAANEATFGASWNASNALAAFTQTNRETQRAIADELKRLREEVAALRAERREGDRSVVRAVERVELATSESAQTQAREFRRAKERGA